MSREDWETWDGPDGRRLLVGPKLDLVHWMGRAKADGSRQVERSTPTDAVQLETLRSTLYAFGWQRERDPA